MQARLPLRTWLSTHVPGAGLRVARTAFYALASAAAVRFMLLGWVDDFYVTPTYHFTWPGFSWVAPLDRAGMYTVFVLKAGSAALCALGIAFRLSALTFFVTHTYVELLDKTYYLNHQYLVGLLGLLFLVLPRESAGPLASSHVPRLSPLLLRIQVGLVYTFAGLAKLGPDFLLRAEPVHTWLLHHGTMPFVGGLLAEPATAHVFSVLGTAFDLGVVVALLMPRLRVAAFVAVVGFHVVTGLLFDIGMFPFYMVALATLILPYDWPLRLLRRAPAGPSEAAHARPVPVALAAVAGLFLLVQIALPLRHLAYPGETNWTERGFRFAWRVMLIEKTGHVEFHTVRADGSRGKRLDPRPELTHLQLQMMSTQPDMIAQYAGHLASAPRLRVAGATKVAAQGWVSLNGRPVRKVFPGSGLHVPVLVRAIK